MGMSCKCFFFDEKHEQQQLVREQIKIIVNRKQNIRILNTIKIKSHELFERPNVGRPNNV